MKILTFFLEILRASFWFCLLFALDQPYLAVLTLFAMIWHEAFHVFALLRISRGGKLRSRLGGLRLFPSETLSYREERRVAAAGPLGGFLGALLCFALSPAAPEYLFDFAFCHLLTSLSNLLPIEGYDGYRILKASLALRERCNAEATARTLSFLFSAFFTLLSLCIFGILGEGLWPSAAFLFTLLGSLPERKNAFFEDFGEKRRFREDLGEKRTFY